MPPRTVVPTLLAATLFGLAAAVLVPSGALGAVAVVAALASGLWSAGLLGGAVAVLVVVRVLAVSVPSVPVGTTVEFSGRVDGVRTEPYAVVRIAEPAALRGFNLRVVSPVDRPLAPGDHVRGSCTTGFLRGPPARWRMQRVAGTCWRVSVTAVEPGAGAFRALASIRAASAARIRRLYPEPASDFLEGFLVGAPPKGSPELTALLRRAGVSHLVAVSGYNLTVLTGALGAVLLPLLGRKFGSLALALALLAFAGISGFAASVLRAAAMAGLQLVAYLVGRPAVLPRLLAASVVVLLWADPALVFDLGFQLSVAATAGIAFLARPLERRLGVLPEAFGFRAALSTSFAATLATAPVLAIAVGRVSVLAPFTTAMLTPAIPPAMALGALSLGAGWIHPSLPLPLVAVEQLLLSAMLGLAGFAGRLPFATVAASPWFAAAVLLALLWVAFRRPRLRPVLPGWVHRR